jgi:hypothetical protein
MNRISTKDKVITSDKTVAFVLQCIAQIGQFPGVDDGLRRKELTMAANAAAEALSRSDEKGQSSLEIPSVDHRTLAAVCGSVIETLEDYRDLGPVLGVSTEEAEDLLGGI